jgi:hypothetical protein
MPVYRFQITLDDPLALILGTVQLTSRGTHHDELFLGDWEVTSVAEIGEPVLATDLGDGDAIATWVSTHYAEVVEALDRWTSRVDPTTVAIDEADRVADEAADRVIDERGEQGE